MSYMGFELIDGNLPQSNQKAIKNALCPKNLLVRQAIVRLAFQEVILPILLLPFGRRSSVQSAYPILSPTALNHSPLAQFEFRWNKSHRFQAIPDISLRG